MTLLTVDAKLMPILPLIARPESERALVVAFGMGTAFRSALIAGLRPTSSSSSRPCPRCSAGTTRTPTAVAGRPGWPGHRHRRPQPPRAERRAVRHHRHRPAAADRELRRLGHLVARSTTRPAATTSPPGGIMMQWVPYGAPESRVQGAHPDVRRGLPGGHSSSGRRRVRRLHARLGRADRLRPEATSAPSSRGPASSRTSRRAYDSPATTVDEWVDVIDRPDLARRRRGRAPTSATARSSPTTARDPSISCCVGCSASGAPIAPPSQLTDGTVTARLPG